MKRFFSILFILIFLSAFSVSCQKNTSSTALTKTGFYFDTVIQITVYSEEDYQYLDECFSIASEYEALFSKTISTSDIYRINHGNGEPVSVSDETLTLLSLGQYYNQLSNGGFDLTIGSLVDLWDVTNNTGILPTEENLMAALSGVGSEFILMEGNNVTLTNSETQLDLGSIAKGYIADQMKAFLNENGVTSGIINLGGNVLVLGPKEDGNTYVIGIQNPFSEDGTALFSLEITNESIVTSGIYQRYFEIDDVIYHHIFDPTTGYPYDNGILSVTIICESSVHADALSTTVFSMGLDNGMALIESLENTEAVFVLEDYSIQASSGIGNWIPLNEYQ